MRSLLLVLHILGVAVWLGANVTQAVVTPRLSRGGGEVAARWWETTVAMGRVLYPPAGFLVLLTGIGLVLSTGYSFSDAFVAVGFVAVIVGIVLGITVFGPRGARAAQLHRGEGGEEVAGVQRTIAQFGVVDTLVLVTAVVAMVMKWGAG